MLLKTLNCGLEFQIDDSDYEVISRYSWYPDSNLYIGTRSNKKFIRLHEFLMGKAPDGYCWDHINNDTTDNRRKNLRLVTRAENNRNRSIIYSNSGYKGVNLLSNGKFAVYVYAFNKSFYIGRFDSLEEAIKIQVLKEKQILA